MAGFGKWLGRLIGGKKPAAVPRAKKSGDEPSRAQLIQNAMAIHRAQGAQVREVLQKSMKSLEDRKTLRDPEALQRALAIVQAQRAIQGLFAGGLKQYLVVSGLREMTGKEPGPDRSSPDKAVPQRRNKVTRR